MYFDHLMHLPFLKQWKSMYYIHMLYNYLLV